MTANLNPDLSSAGLPTSGEYSEADTASIVGMDIVPIETTNDEEEYSGKKTFGMNFRSRERSATSTIDGVLTQQAPPYVSTGRIAKL